MLRPPRAARLIAAFVSLLLTTALASACGSDEADTPAAAGAAGGAFPVTIAHKYGQTTIKAEPKRIVTVGLTDQDAVLALGKVPVGTTEWFGEYPGAIGPWAKDKVGGASLPTVLKDTGTGPQVEKIAALRPDLILAVYGGLTDKQYQSLSKFAPVVAQPKQYVDYGVPWQEQTKMIGKALGKDAEAGKLVTALEQKFAKARADNPEFDGKTAVTGTPYEGHFVYGRQDLRTRTLALLGFSLPEDLDKVVGTKEFGVSISKERTDLLDQDVIVWTVAEVAKEMPKLHADKLYADLNVVKQGREVYVGENTPYGVAYSFQSVLSLPFVIDRLVPQLKAAVDGNPATKVEQPAS
ncbi:iron-siderophore ABC transporter substrate-binding protein [Actinomadura madurae]|uniref:Iron complex transport system substrate-binding protein n=1 Tax=Actinomadura madurae TaxID=1993 RepID=A0A1I5GMX9_9ACTN|nr:iron-siderophore ABC transporter substrate-binding protein [Actinomadura madurae]SFO37297.1 iron complex transport system substrate-binding protein [Actinomadura madurae]SPT51412.1 Putative ABC transporter substrate-binding lipoprotein yhfQ precursor [Actinomadura madurae]